MPKGVYQHKKGWHVSAATKKKLSLINKGKFLSEEHKKKISMSHTGKKKSAEHRKHIGDAFRGRKLSAERRASMSGANNHNWKGGITKGNRKIRNSAEYRLWRKAVLQRDGGKCIWCGSPENVEADHIKPFAHYPELRFAIDNGRTLCKPCHTTTDTFCKH